MKRIAGLLSLLLVLSACGQTAPQTLPPTSQPAATTEQTTEPVTEPATEPATEPTEPPVVRHSGLREDGTFSEGTWFIGDSMTCILVEDYLIPKGLIGDASYTGKYGAHITAFFDGTMMTKDGYNHCAFRPEHEFCTYQRVAYLLGEKATAIYIMFGTNFTWNAYADAYIEIAEYLLVQCPNATIHLQLIPWGNEYVVEYETVNGWIQEAYDYFVEIGEERVMLIDTFTAIGRNPDIGGTHLNEQGNENWYNAIRDHAEANGLVE